ncbi:hypothetical protein FQN49_005895 [Arthroderma sp. PD_2]|nr:hypothetical protein FQN49_005895 [Arthroderma sp. PD_2]
MAVPNEIAVTSNFDTSNESSADSLASLQEFLLAHPRIRFLRFQWQDHSGILRARLTPLEQALAIAAGKRQLKIGCIAFHCVVDNTLLPDFDPRGNHLLVPDWSSLRTRQPFDPLYASVMCEIAAQYPARPGLDWSLCPRHALSRFTKRAEETIKGHFLVGLEVEFEIMKANEVGKLIPYSGGLGIFAVSGLRDPCFTYVEEVIQILMDAGVEIDTFQAEGIRGQYEISLGPLPPVQAIDQLLFVHDTIKHVFARRGLVATMSPRPVGWRGQSAGQHAHISINPPHKEESFLAGILGRLPQLCAFFLPYELSYERIKKYFAGTMVAWGTENRTAPVRKVKAGHWEVRCADATANMYLALAAILSAGMIGYVNDEPLQWQDTGLDEQPLPDSGTMLPKTVDEAMGLLQTTFEELEVMMGSQVIRHYLRVKKFEVSKLHGIDSEEVRQLLAELF